MKKTPIYMIIAMLLTLLPLHAQQSEGLNDFDRDVLAARRHMRSYCALIQSAMKNNDDLTAQKSLPDIKQAGNLWEKIQKKYSKNPPAEYADDAKFTGRLKTFQLLLDEMAYNVEQKKYQMSFNNCAFACGLFVKMHEENNLIYVSDRLFHLRKAIKKATALQAAGLPLAGVFADIQQLRNQVYRAPFPDNNNFLPKMEELSLSIDRIVYRIYHDGTDLHAMLTDLTDQINTLYSLSL